MSLLTKTDNFLEKQLLKFWELEQTKSLKPSNPKDILCEIFFISSIKFCEDGRYMVYLPFKDGIDPQIGDSKKIVLRRFYNLEQKLQKNNNLRRDYTNLINEYINEGHLIRD